MDRDRIEGNWRELKGKIKAQWGDLTDDDLDRIDGRREELLGTLQKRYGKSKDDYRKDLERIEAESRTASGTRRI